MYCDCPILGRCCFCLPLRKGILLFGYINLFFSAFMIGVYSYMVHEAFYLFTLYHGASTFIPAEICVAMYCAELIFNAILIYGTHMKQMIYIRVFYYFAITTTAAAILIQILEIAFTLSGPYMMSPLFIEAAPIMLASVCIQVYLIILIRSLLRKMDVSSGPNVYDNPLQQIVFEGRTESNTVVQEPTSLKSAKQYAEV